MNDDHFDGPDFDDSAGAAVLEQVMRALDPRDVTSTANQPMEDMGIDPAQFFRQTIEQTRMAIAVTDPHRPDNPIVFINQAFEKQTGYARAEIVGRNCRFLQGEDTDPDAVARIRDALAAQRV